MMWALISALSRTLVNTTAIHTPLAACRRVHALLPPARPRRWTVMRFCCAPPLLLANLSPLAPLSLLFVSPILLSPLSLSLSLVTLISPDAKWLVVMQVVTAPPGW